MAKVKFELNRAGVNALLNSSGIQGYIQARGQYVMSKLPSGYVMQSGTSANDGRRGPRAKVTIYTDSTKARIDNAKNNTLLKALGG